MLIRIIFQNLLLLLQKIKINEEATYTSIFYFPALRIRYFGAARNLPGVKELFQKKEGNPSLIFTFAEKKPKKQRKNFSIDADYYGYDEDNILVPIERNAEIKALEESLKSFDNMKADPSRAAYINTDDLTELPVPTRDEMHKAVLERRKHDLMQKILNNQ